MGASVSAFRRHLMPALPRISEAVREKLTRERMVEAAVIAATVAAILVLSNALQLGLERYTMAGL